MLARRVALVGLVAVMLAGCGDALFVSPAPRIPAGLAIAYSLALSSNSDAGAVFDKADRIHVRITGNGMLVDTVLAFVPAAEARVRVPVSVAEPGRVYQVDVELRRNTDVLFSGTTTATLSEGQTSTAQVSLVPVFTSVTLQSSIPAFKAVGDTLTLQTTGVFATGDTVVSSAQNRSFSWKSSNDSIATADTNGLVRARRAGIATITATAPGAGGSSDVTVRVMAANDIAGFWTGTYSWFCSATNSGSSQISFNISVQPGSTDFTGLTTYLGGSGGVTGARYGDTFTFQGPFRTRLKDPDGAIINFTIPLSATFTNNVFTGTLSGKRITGETLNGEHCSAATGPSGSFDIQKQ